jgi:hypothetical protein
MAPGQAYQSPQSKAAWITITDRTLALRSSKVPCAEFGSEVLLPKSAVRADKDRYIGHTENLDFDFTAKMVSDGGLDYICPN